MKKLRCTSAFCCIAVFTFAQDFADKNLQEIVNAEREFAALAKTKNTREAFLTFLSDSAITFSPDGPVLGRKEWETRAPDESLLSWYPIYAEISHSGDFGFDFGPWEFRPARSDEKAVAFGHFVTVWKKQDDGRWRVATDIGISHGPQKQDTQVTTTSVRALHGENMSSSFYPETTFITSYHREKGGRAYGEALSEEARIFRNGNFPARTKESVEKILSIDRITSFKMQGCEMASSGDLAFVYGTAEVVVEKDGKPEAKKASYVRIWKKEEGAGWKIVLDIVT